MNLRLLGDDKQMEISFLELKDELVYQIKNVGSDFLETLKHIGYVKKNDVYSKSFPLPFPYKEKIMNNFQRNAESMLNEEAGLAPMNWQAGLEKFASIAQKEGISWWTSGAILLPLNGIEADINDLDFFFSLSDLDAVYKVFQDYIIEPIVSGYRSDTFKYHGLAYSGCTICIFVEPRVSLDVPNPVHFGPYAADHLEKVIWRGYEIKVPPIELYVKTLESWGKTERAESIRKALHK
ncbi:MAG: hypothetical protein PHD30_09510 [Paludibacter sp.]|nr:hypothetical protein [Paludibacter sp.]